MRCGWENDIKIYLGKKNLLLWKVDASGSIYALVADSSEHHEKNMVSITGNL
jgi:hypothetical protein